MTPTLRLLLCGDTADGGESDHPDYVVIVTADKHNRHQDRNNPPCLACSKSNGIRP